MRVTWEFNAGDKRVLVDYDINNNIYEVFVDGTCIDKLNFTTYADHPNDVQISTEPVPKCKCESPKIKPWKEIRKQNTWQTCGDCYNICNRPKDV